MHGDLYTHARLRVDLPDKSEVVSRPYFPLVLPMGGTCNTVHSLWQKGASSLGLLVWSHDITCVFVSGCWLTRGWSSLQVQAVRAAAEQQINPGEFSGSSKTTLLFRDDLSHFSSWFLDSRAKPGWNMTKRTKQTPRDKLNPPFLA